MQEQGYQVPSAEPRDNTQLPPTNNLLVQHLQEDLPQEVPTLQLPSEPQGDLGINSPFHAKGAPSQDEESQLLSPDTGNNLDELRVLYQLSVPDVVVKDYPMVSEYNSSNFNENITTQPEDCLSPIKMESNSVLGSISFTDQIGGVGQTDLIQTFIQSKQSRINCYKEQEQNNFQTAQKRKEDLVKMIRETFSRSNEHSESEPPARKKELLPLEDPLPIEVNINVPLEQPEEAVHLQVKFEECKLEMVMKAEILQERSSESSMLLSSPEKDKQAPIQVSHPQEEVEYSPLMTPTSEPMDIESQHHNEKTEKFPNCPPNEPQIPMDIEYDENSNKETHNNRSEALPLPQEKQMASSVEIYSSIQFSSEEVAVNPHPHPNEQNNYSTEVNYNQESNIQDKSGCLKPDEEELLDSCQDLQGKEDLPVIVVTQSPQEPEKTETESILEHPVQLEQGVKYSQVYKNERFELKAPISLKNIESDSLEESEQSSVLNLKKEISYLVPIKMKAEPSEGLPNSSSETTGIVHQLDPEEMPAETHEDGPSKSNGSTIFKNLSCTFTNQQFPNVSRIIESSLSQKECQSEYCPPREAVGLIESDIEEINQNLEQLEHSLSLQESIQVRKPVQLPGLPEQPAANPQLSNIFVHNSYNPHEQQSPMMEPLSQLNKRMIVPSVPPCISISINRHNEISLNIFNNNIFPCQRQEETRPSSREVSEAVSKTIKELSHNQTVLNETTFLDEGQQIETTFKVQEAKKSTSLLCENQSRTQNAVPLELQEPYKLPSLLQDKSVQVEEDLPIIIAIPASEEQSKVVSFLPISSCHEKQELPSLMSPPNIQQRPAMQIEQPELPLIEVPPQETPQEIYLKIIDKADAYLLNSSPSEFEEKDFQNTMKPHVAPRLMTHPTSEVGEIMFKDGLILSAIAKMFTKTSKGPFLAHYVFEHLNSAFILHHNQYIFHQRAIIAREEFEKHLERQYTESYFKTRQKLDETHQELQPVRRTLPVLQEEAKVKEKEKEIVAPVERIKEKEGPAEEVKNTEEVSPDTIVKKEHLVISSNCYTLNENCSKPKQSESIKKLEGKKPKKSVPKEKSPSQSEIEIESDASVEVKGKVKMGSMRFSAEPEANKESKNDKLNIMKKSFKIDVAGSPVEKNSKTQHPEVTSSPVVQMGSTTKHPDHRCDSGSQLMTSSNIDNSHSSSRFNVLLEKYKKIRENKLPEPSSFTKKPAFEAPSGILKTNPDTDKQGESKKKKNVKFIEAPVMQAKEESQEEESHMNNRRRRKSKGKDNSLEETTGDEGVPRTRKHSRK